MGMKGERKSSGILVNLSVMLIAVVIGLIAVEIGLRVFWHNPYKNENLAKVLTLQLQPPNRDIHLPRNLIDPSMEPARFRTDERSYIIPSYQYENPDYTIAFLGASTSECAAVKEELRFHAHVSTLLGEKGLKVNTLNSAKWGNTTQDALNIFLNHIILDDPDVVVMMHALNDCGVLERDPEYRTRMGFRVNFSRLSKWSVQLLSQHLEMIAFFRYRRTPMPGFRAAGFNLTGELIEEQYSRRLRAFVHLARDFDVVPVLMTQPAASFKTELSPGWLDFGFQDQANEVIRKVAAEEGAVLIDLVSLIRENIPEFNEPNAVFYDGVHYTDYGSTRIAEFITEIVFEEVLKDKAKKVKPDFKYQMQRKRLR